MRLTCVFIVVLLGGCAPVETAPAPLAAVEHLSPMPQANPMPQVQKLGATTKGRPIEMTLFSGDASRSVLIIGGIHGDEPTSVEVAQNLIDLLRSQPQLAAGRRLAIIANANPDGGAASTRQNACGIDLNRNFPAANFRPNLRGRYQSGQAPLSEPESRAIADAIERIHPTLLISIHSIPGGKQCNNYDGPAQHVAQVMSRHNGYPAKDTIGYQTPGSLGSWAGRDLNIPMITLELPRRLSAEQAWAQNREALLAAIRAQI